MEMHIHYNYGRRTDFPIYGNRLNPQNVLVNQFSRHHIISYPMMRTYAEVVNRSLVVINNNEKLNTLYNKLGVNNNEVINRITWAYANLFVGPSSTYRGDDPSQKRDGYPLGFPEDRKQKVKELTNYWNKLSNSYLVGEQNTEIDIKLKGSNNDYYAFLKCILEYSNMVNDANHIYITKLDEWVVKAENNTTYGDKCYRFYFGKKDDSGNWESDILKLKFYLATEKQELSNECIAITRFSDGFLEGKKMKGLGIDINNIFVLNDANQVKE